MRIGRVVLLPAVAATAYAVGRHRGRNLGAGQRPATDSREPAGAADPTEPAGPADPAGHRVPSPRELPGVDAGHPLAIPFAGWRQVLRRAGKETLDDNIPMLAAGVAFYGFLSLFPALIAAVTVYGLVADPEQVREQVESLSRALPADAAGLVSRQLTEIAASSDRALGLGLVVSLLGALFTASGGVANLIKAVNVAYDEQETRGFLKLRALALLLTVGAVVFVAIAVGLVAVLPVVLDPLGLGGLGRALVGVLRWVGLIASVALALAIVYRHAPDRDNPRMAWVSLGAGVGTLLWILGSVGFSVYVGNFGSYTKTYGALAGVAVLLLWLFLTAFVVLLGAEINSELEHQTAVDSTVGPPKPLGGRRAVMADTVASGG